MLPNARRAYENSVYSVERKPARFNEDYFDRSSNASSAWNMQRSVETQSRKSVSTLPPVVKLQALKKSARSKSSIGGKRPTKSQCITESGETSLERKNERRKRITAILDNLKDEELEFVDQMLIKDENEEGENQVQPVHEDDSVSHYAPSYMTYWDETRSSNAYVNGLI